MWIEKPAGAPLAPVPQTCTVMLEAVELTHVISGIVSEGGGPARAVLAIASAVHIATGNTNFLPKGMIHPPSLSKGGFHRGKWKMNKTACNTLVAAISRGARSRLADTMGDSSVSLLTWQ